MSEDNFEEVEVFFCPECDEMNENHNELFTEKEAYIVQDDVYPGDVYLSKEDIYEELTALECKKCGYLFDPGTEDHLGYAMKCLTCGKLYDDEEDAENCCRK